VFQELPSDDDVDFLVLQWDFGLQAADVPGVDMGQRIEALLNNVDSPRLDGWQQSPSLRRRVRCCIPRRERFWPLWESD
jgi:hypothetical protein